MGPGGGKRWSVLAALLCACDYYSAGQPDADAGPPAPPDATHCEAADLPAPPPVTPGDVRLEVIADGGWGPGARIAIEPDGTVSGHGWDDLWMCAGELTLEEAAEIADAFDDADVFRACSNPQPCVDHLVYDITAEGVAGAAVSWENSFRYEVCVDDIPALDRFVATALAPIERLSAGSECTGCPIDYAADSCYGAEFGSRLLCLDGVAHPCNLDSAGGEVTDCGGSRPRPSVECSASAGWVPAAIWSIDQLVLWRTLDDGGGTPRIYLQIAVMVDNRGATPIDLTQILDYWRFLDPDGQPMPLVNGPYGGGIELVVAPGNSLATYQVNMNSGTNPGSPILTVPSASVQLTERPYPEAVLTPPVAIEFRAGQPY